jgi:hypothetical protein
MRARGEELRCQCLHVDLPNALELRLPPAVLLGMAVTAQGYGPAVTRLQTRPAVCTVADVRAFDSRFRSTCGTSETANPGAMGWAAATLIFPMALAVYAGRQRHQT